MTFDDIYNLLATQKAIIEKQDEIITNKDIIISDLSRIKDIQEEQIKRLKRRLNSVVNDTPKTGHWIDIHGDNAKCSCCNRLNHVYGTYCKHCGAKNDIEKVNR